MGYQSQWSVTADNNKTADPSVNLREGQAPSTVNDAVRAVMAQLAKFRDDFCGKTITAGSATAYTLASAEGISTLFDGWIVGFQAHASNTGAATLNVNSSGAKPLRTATGVALVAGQVKIGGKYMAIYDSSEQEWILLGFFPVVQDGFPSGTRMLFQQTTPPTGWTKDTTKAQHAVRITDTDVSSGGSVNFTTAFASQSVAGTVGNTTLSADQIPAHKHLMVANEQVNGNQAADPSDSNQIARSTSNVSDFNTSLRGTSTAATIGLTASTGGGEAHTHSFTGTAINLAVKYLDFSLAVKD